MDAPDLPIHRWLGRTDAERRWLAGLPRLVAELADRWQVRTGPPFTTGTSWLPRTATRTVLVHGDANPDNLLAAHRGPWLAIDAKPMLGDPAYDAHPLLAQLTPAPAGSPVTLAGRYRTFADLVGLPAERLLRWALARTVEGALWSVSRDDRPAAGDAMARAAALARATS